MIEAFYERSQQEVGRVWQRFGLELFVQSDVSPHLPLLFGLAAGSEHVIELGTHDCSSTWAFVAARPQRLTCVDICRLPQVDEVADACRRLGIDFTFHEMSSLDFAPETCDLLFIDSKHTRDQLRAELERHGDKVRRYIAMHDTKTFGRTGEDGGPGLVEAYAHHFALRQWWMRMHDTPACNGLTVFARTRA